MKKQEIKFKSKNHNYSIIIGKNTINILPKKIRLLCPSTKKIAIILYKTYLKSLCYILKDIGININVV